MTSDGQDLDARYLGINDKAKAAESADKASSVDISGIVGMSLPKLASVPVQIALSFNTATKTWEAPSEGFLILANVCGNASGTINANRYVTLNGVGIPGINGAKSDDNPLTTCPYFVPVKPADQVKVYSKSAVYGGYLNGWFIPCTYNEETENV